MNYTVLRTVTADGQTKYIARYMTEVSRYADSALRSLDQLDEVAEKPAIFSTLGAVPSWGTLAKRGYRKSAFDKHLLLYKVDDEIQTVTIHFVVDSRWGYWKIVELMRVFAF